MRLRLQLLLSAFPLFTINWNLKLVVFVTNGDVNVGLDLLSFDNTTAGPPANCSREKVSEWPFGSQLLFPSSVTWSDECTFWFDPASPTGIVVVWPVGVLPLLLELWTLLTVKEFELPGLVGGQLVGCTTTVEGVLVWCTEVGILHCWVVLQRC